MECAITPEKPMGREVFYRALEAAERKHLPVVDVCAAGGWKRERMLLGIYQQPDLDTMLAVMSESRKVSDRATGT